jgi:hypothetical protein
MPFAVPVNTDSRGKDFVEEAIAWLRERLPSSFKVERSSRPEISDRALEIQGPHSNATLLVDAKLAFGPRDVAGVLRGVAKDFRAMNPWLRVLVVAPWLSRRSQELLAAEDLDYLDLTGNALIRLENPAVFVQAQGATSDPWAASRPRARLRGPKAGRLIRFLVDVRPPYGVSQIAAATALTPGYVSRVLATLDGEALITRAARGVVASVQLDALVRRWSETYDVFKTNDARAYLAPAGAQKALRQLASAHVRSAVTGSFAAVRLAPVAGPALLCAYTDEVDALSESLDLIPTDAGANVALLRPFDGVVWARCTELDGVNYVAPSQVAVDCLTGNGRMPSEGDAVLGWLGAHEEAWRVDSIRSVRDG